MAELTRIGLMPTQWLACGIIGTLASLLVGTAWFAFPHLMVSWEGSTYDARLRWRGPEQTTPHLVLIGRDQRSDAQLGLGIWDRAILARVVQALSEVGAAVVAADFYFTETSPPERGGAASDAALVAATKVAGNVIYPLPLILGQPDTPSKINDSDSSLDSLLFFSGSPPLNLESVRHLYPVTTMELPLPALAKAAISVGHIAASSDSDGVYRAVPAFVNLGGRPFPAFGVTIAAVFLQIPPDQIVIEPGRSLKFLGAHPLPRRTDGASQALSLPIDASGRLLVNYAGRWVDSPFPYFSFVDVWDAIEEGRLAELRQQVQGKIVLLLHAGVESDKRQTPLDTVAPGGFIHANVVNTILLGQGLRELSTLGRALVVWTLGVGATWILLAVPSWVGVGLVVTLGVMFLLLTHLALALGGAVIPVVTPLGALVAASGMALGWTRWTSSSQILRLETERIGLHRVLASTQELLARQESRAEHLEEDLATLRATIADDTAQRHTLTEQVKTLHQALAEAQKEVDTTRENLRTLEGQLSSIQITRVDRSALSDTDKETLRKECESHGIITRNATMLKLFRDLKKAARVHTPVLLLGEPGTGKELFARALHKMSARTSSPFIPVNMAALPSDLFESELFGHVKGAFTGAGRDRVGFFEQAHHGTIFLDEIGDLRVDLQAKLLRVLQEGMFYRVGDTRPTTVDVRVVTATNRDLLQGIAQGWFREDLYFRLRGIEFYIPPLRERPEDLHPLAERLNLEAARGAGRQALSLSSGAVEALKRGLWKGNVRELKQCLEQAVVLAEGNLILEQDLRLDQPPTGQPGPAEESPPSIEKISGDQVFLAYLRQHRFDMQTTARALGWERSTVTQRLKGLSFKALLEQKGDRGAAAEFLAGDPSLKRVVEIKLDEYVDHLFKVVSAYSSTEQALADCRRRFKNLPSRYMPAVEALVRQSGERKSTPHPTTPL